MSVPLADLKLEVKKLLDQALDMSLGEVTDGAGGVSMSNDAVLLSYLNLGQEEIARTCYPIFGAGAKTNYPAGGRFIGLHTLTPNTGVGRLWAALQVAFDSAPLQFVRHETFANRVPDYAFKTSGTPRVWFDAGTTNTVGIDPAPPNGTKTLSVFGLCLPPLLYEASGGAPAAALDFMADDEAYRLVPAAAAILIAKKKYDDASIYGRLGHLIPDYDERRTRLYARIEPGLRAWRFPVPPVLMAPAGPA